MLVARRSSGERIEASRSLANGDFYCPLCGGAVILKRGRVKVAHFAHQPGAVCDYAGESVRHLLAKRVLADRFRALGYTVDLEEPHLSVNRRVDVAVTVPLSGARIAVEVQDSPIKVDEMKRRIHADKMSGFFGTVWVFTSRRAARLLGAQAAHEIRVPDEIRYLQNRYRLGVFVIEENEGRMWRCHFGNVVRTGESHEWYTPEGELTGTSYPDRALRATKTVARRETGFALEPCPARYHKPGSPDLAVIFAGSPRHDIFSRGG